MLCSWKKKNVSLALTVPLYSTRSRMCTGELLVSRDIKLGEVSRVAIPLSTKEPGVKRCRLEYCHLSADFNNTVSIVETIVPCLLNKF